MGLQKWNGYKMSITTPIKLQRNKKYPSYQLYAVAGTPQMDADEVFKVCILHTYKWLRARFEGFTLKELEVPEPSDVPLFALSSIHGFSIADPYPIEVFWLPEDKVWCLKLTEPDNGSTATDFRPARDGVAGRLFETGIGYRITEKGVECGFKTIVSESEGVDEPVESFRLACIKDIARDPNAGLYHGYKLQDEPVSIESSADVKRLIRWIRSDERQMPVILSDQGVKSIKDKTPEALPTIEQFLASQSLTRFGSAAQIVEQALLVDDLPVSKEQSTVERVEIRKLARYRMGYAQYFSISGEMSELVKKELKEAYSQGDFNILEPESFGGRTRSYDAFDEKTEQRLDRFASSYPAKKPMTFGSVLFTNDARELSSRHIADLAESKEAIVQAYEERIAAIHANHEDELSSCRASLEDQIRETNRLEKILNDIQVEIAKNNEIIQSRHREEIRRLSAGYEDAIKELERYRSLDRRPVDFGSVLPWVDSEFAGRLILHERAKEMLSELKTGEWDIGLICDALEFLATDYRDELTGSITEDEMKSNCSRKYGRPFDVTPLSGLSIQSAPKEYKIKYYTGFKGKPVESLLDLHLRVGNSAEDLIRIYFLYDKDKKVIVVGSLPKHLPTLSYR